jgi:hypothetical protein
MAWIFRRRGNGGGAPMSAEYECPVHGRFTETVARDTNGDPPGSMPCTSVVHDGRIDPPCCPIDAPCEWHGVDCGESSQWRISAPAGRVKAGEVVQGKVTEYPPDHACLDTRPLADGMPLHEWRAKQDRITRDAGLKRVRKSMGRA